MALRNIDVQAIYFHLQRNTIPFDTRGEAMPLREPPSVHAPLFPAEDSTDIRAFTGVDADDCPWNDGKVLRIVQGECGNMSKWIH